MKLYIAEKPSLGRAIAAALPKPHKKQQGYIEVGNGDVVSWCIGHLLEQADPEVYDQQFKKWQFDHLPIIPEQWQLTAKTKTRSQLTVLRKLVKQAKQLVHAGDPDREGQLLVDEVIDYFKVSQSKKQQMQRLLVSDLNIDAVKKALIQVKSNQEFVPLSVSALARSRADWLYGINLTRAYTIQGQKSGFHGILSVGRVQTPVLGLVVRRDQEISNFVAHPYYEVDAQLTTEKGEGFTAQWQPSDACTPHMDSEGRIINKALAENVVNRISQQPAKVTDLKQEQKKQSAPLTYNLSALQIDAAKQFAMSAKQVLDICQSLYEKHQLITYPRSDCRYLPTEHFKEASNILPMLAQANISISKFVEQADTQFKSKVWNNSKVGAHHAIIPTIKSPAKVSLSKPELQIYQLISRQYLAQFFPAYIYQQTRVEVEIAGGKFMTKANMPQQQGWKVLYQSSKKANNTDQESQLLPQLKVQQELFCQQGILLEKMTQPPKAYTDASLLSAMTGIARYVTDKSIKRVLRDTDGIGTEATRAGIIELLFKRGFLTRTGKSISATDLGKSLINVLPEQATLPDMTAQWELALNQISERQLSYQHFMLPLNQVLNNMVQGASQQSFSGLPKVPFKPKRKAYRGRKRSNNNQNK